MKTTKITGIDFSDPNIKIEWGIHEEDLMSILMCEKTDSHFYMFEAKLSSVNIDVLSRITFHNDGFKMEIIVSQTLQKREENSKTTFVDTSNMNFLKGYVENKFGNPKLFSRIFSAIIKPFYIHKWKFDKIKVSHKYQDSVIGFYECLLFDMKY